jgi:hypothetical protein
MGATKELGAYPLIAQASDEELREYLHKGMCVCWRQQQNAARFEEVLVPHGSALREVRGGELELAGLEPPPP